MYTVWTTLTFAINYLVWMYSCIWKHFHIISEPDCFSTRTMWIKQRSSLVNPVVTKLQFIRIKTELVHIGKRRTTSFNENDTRVNRHCKYNASNKRGNSNTTKVCHFVSPPCMSVYSWRSGVECEKEIDECALITCHNAGQCISTQPGHAATCLCTPAFTGI